MPAYLIVTATISDREAFLTGYGAKAASLVEKFGGKYLMRVPGVTLLEGNFGDGGSVVISEWESRDAALFLGTIYLTSQRANRIAVA